MPLLLIMLMSLALSPSAKVTAFLFPNPLWNSYIFLKDWLNSQAHFYTDSSKNFLQISLNSKRLKTFGKSVGFITIIKQNYVDHSWNFMCRLSSFVTNSNFKPRNSMQHYKMSSCVYIDTYIAYIISTQTRL